MTWALCEMSERQLFPVAVRVSGWKLSPQRWVNEKAIDRIIQSISEKEPTLSSFIMVATSMPVATIKLSYS